MKKVVLFFTLLFFAGISLAQQEYGVHFMNGTWQATMTNPAQLPTNKITISLPEFYGNLGISNITYNDIFDAQGSADFDNAISQLDEHNYFRTNLAFQTFGIGIRTKRLFFSLNHEIRSNTSVNYPKELAQLIWQGNAQFIGRQIAFEPNMEFRNWHQIAIGVGLQLSDNITLGARLKTLSGIVDLSNDRDGYLHLTTSEDIYQLSVDADYVLRTSGALDFADISNYNFSYTGIDFNSFDKLFKSNPGFAIDLGASVSFGKFNFQASALDVGSINWKDNVTQYGVKGSFDFEGLSFAEDIFSDSLATPVVLDSLKNTFNPDETHDAYRTALPKQFYLSGSYALTEFLKVGALFYTEIDNKYAYPAFTLAANYSLSAALKVGASYSVKKGSADNLGLSAALKLGPIQLVAATDNVFTVLNPKNHNHANGRVGLNLVFGKADEAKGSSSPTDFY